MNNQNQQSLESLYKRILQASPSSVHVTRVSGIPAIRWENPDKTEDALFVAMRSSVITSPLPLLEGESKMAPIMSVLPPSDWGRSWTDGGVVAMRSPALACLSRLNVEFSQHALSLLGRDDYVLASDTPGDMEVQTYLISSLCPTRNSPSQWSRFKPGMRLPPPPETISARQGAKYQSSGTWVRGCGQTPPPEYLNMVPAYLMPSFSSDTVGAIIPAGLYYFKGTSEAYHSDGTIRGRFPQCNVDLLHVDFITRNKDNNYDEKVFQKGHPTFPSPPTRAPTCCPAHYAQFFGYDPKNVTTLSMDVVKQVVSRSWKTMLALTYEVSDPLQTLARGAPLVKFVQKRDTLVADEISKNFKYAFSANLKYNDIKSHVSKKGEPMDCDLFVGSHQRGRMGKKDSEFDSVVYLHNPNLSAVSVSVAEFSKNCSFMGMPTIGCVSNPRKSSDVLVKAKEVDVYGFGIDQCNTLHIIAASQQTTIQGKTPLAYGVSGDMQMRLAASLDPKPEGPFANMELMMSPEEPTRFADTFKGILDDLRKQGRLGDKKSAKKAPKEATKKKKKGSNGGRTQNRNAGQRVPDRARKLSKRKASRK